LSILQETRSCQLFLRRTEYEKITIDVLIVLTVAGFIFTGCTTDAGEDPITVTGKASRTIPGVGTAGVEVTLTLTALTTDWRITAVDIKASSEDTGGVCTSVHSHRRHKEQSHSTKFGRD
jgi:hypothetical protein